VLKEDVINSGATVVIRPDSGEPATVVSACLRLLDEHFGSTINDKGFKVLNNVRVIQGDGINHESINEILATITREGFSADNVAFGQGGALLQIVNRDDQKFAMKCSAALVNGEWIDVFKDPITDPGKQSKKGRVTLYKDTEGKFFSDVMNKDFPDELITVFENGRLVKEYNFDEVRKNASV